MQGIDLTSEAVQGALNGAGYAIDSLSSTLNSSALWVVATMLIGLSIGIGLALYLFAPRQTLGSYGKQTGVSDAYYAQKYLATPNSDIRLASNQEFIRSWAKSHP